MIIVKPHPDGALLKKLMADGIDAPMDAANESNTNVGIYIQFPLLGLEISSPKAAVHKKLLNKIPIRPFWDSIGGGD
ncbi:5577_t:CDS:2 [Ambispora leptoticha]|uniref:5577_t:CDS:1 n=1 Tax=Ambispora leptoticha TaxID=144679 RepID=A0A9N9EZF3_9GLOM|nr:5577_t:CDS:2 [Ambispora leptoticha]